MTGPRIPRRDEEEVDLDALDQDELDLDSVAPKTRADTGNVDLRLPGDSAATANAQPEQPTFMRRAMTSIGDFFSNDEPYAGGFSAGKVGGDPTKPVVLPNMRPNKELRRPKALPTTLTPAQQREQQRQADVAKLERGAGARDVTTVASAPSEVAARKTARALTTKNAEEARRFSPKKWKEIADQGDAHAKVLRAQGDTAGAERVSAQAYNARLLSEDVERADTFGAIALSNLLGIVSDPYAEEQRNIRDIQEGNLTFDPEEQTKIGVKEPAATRRGFDIKKDMLAPAVGELPLIIGGGLAGRGVTALAGTALRGVGAEGAASIADLLGASIETDRAASLGTRSLQRAGRGAVEGNLVSAVNQARIEQQRGGDPLEVGALSLLLGGATGAIGEVALGGAGDLMRAGRISFRERWAAHLSQLEDEAVKREVPVLGQPIEQERMAAGKTALADKMPEAQLNDLGALLDTYAGERAAARPGELADAFNSSTYEPAGPDWWQQNAPEPAPESKIIVPPTYNGPRNDNPELRTQQQLFAPPVQRPTDALDISKNLAAEQTANDARMIQARLDQAAAMAPDKKQGPLNLAQTLRNPEARSAVGVAGIGAAAAAEDKDKEGDSKLPLALAFAGALALPAESRERFFSRLEKAVKGVDFAVNKARSAGDWLGKLKGMNAFNKKEFESVLRPALEQAQEEGRTLTKQDVLDLTQQNRIQISEQRLTTGGKDIIAGGEEIRPPASPTDPEGPAVRVARQARQDQIDELQSNVDYHDRRMAEHRRDAEIALENAGVSTSVLHQALERFDDGEGMDIDRVMSHIQENGDLPYDPRLPDNFRESHAANSYTIHRGDGESWTAPTRFEAMALAEADPRSPLFGGTDQILPHGFKVEEETPEPSFEIRDEGGRHVEWYDTREEAEAALADHPGGRIEEGDTDPEFVLRDKDGDELARGSDREDMIHDYVYSNFQSDNDSILDEVRNSLERYNEEMASYRENESEHYSMTEGDDDESWLTEAREEDDNDPDWQVELAQSRGLIDTPPEPGDERPRLKGTGNTKWAQYQRVPGGKNYREVLLTHDNAPEAFTEGHWRDTPSVIAHMRMSEHEHFSGVEEPQFLKDAKAKRDALGAEQADVIRRYNQMGELDGPDQRALAREYQDINDRVVQADQAYSNMQDAAQQEARMSGAKPEKVLNVFEAQSDWIQQGNKKGFRDPAEIAKLRKEAEGHVQVKNEAGEWFVEHDFNGSPVINDTYPDPNATSSRSPWLQITSKEEAEASRQQIIQNHIDNQMEGRVPATPFGETSDVLGLAAGRMLLEAADGDYDRLAWSTATNRKALAGLSEDAGRVTYDSVLKKAIPKLIKMLGGPASEVEKVRLGGYDHWSVKMTPEIRELIKKHGVPTLGVLGAIALSSEDAKAQASNAAGYTEANMYTTLAGGAIAGAALVWIAQNRAARRLLAENRDLARELLRDDLTGLTNKRGLKRAITSIDADEKTAWLVFDGDQFKKLNDTHGHAAGDKALQHFGQTMMDVAKEKKVPMRAFRAGGDEFAFAVSKDRAEEVLRAIEKGSVFEKDGVTTKLSGMMGNTYDEADALLIADKEARRQANPSLRRGATPAKKPDDAGGATLYANPIAPALRELRRSPTPIALAALGIAAEESDDKKVQRTGTGLLALAAINAIGSARLTQGGKFLANKLVERLRVTERGERAVNFFSPDALLTPEVRKAILDFEGTVAKGRARSVEFAGKAKKLGPSGDRAVSDVIEGEGWENVSNMSAKDMTAVITVASQIAKEFEDIGDMKVAAGILKSTEKLPDYLPRRYAEYDAQQVMANYDPVRSGGGKKARIAAKKTRTLDEPIRDAERALQSATATGDPKAINAAQDVLDEARAVQLSQRIERGEIREASYRTAYGVEKGYADVAAAKLFDTIRTAPGAVHPEYLSAVDDFMAARDMFKNAATKADKDAATQMMRDAELEMGKVSRRFSVKGGDYVTLPDTQGLGALRGAVVKREIGDSLNGLPESSAALKLMQFWKESKTVWNPGTHVANVVSNTTMAHMAGMSMVEQPYWLGKAFKDLRNYGEGTRALAEAGVLGVNSVTAGAEGVTRGSQMSERGLRDLMKTTRPETADVLRERGIKDQRANKLMDAASGARDVARNTYGAEDDVFRVAMYLKAKAGKKGFAARGAPGGMGMLPDQATQYAHEAFGNFRTRSPFLKMMRTSVAPFILYPAKAVPAFAKNVADHPWRYLTLVSSWALLDQMAKEEMGPVDDKELAVRDRDTFGYLFPGITQLPFGDEETGGKATTDIARWTPFAAATQGAQPGVAATALSEKWPQFLSVSGPGGDLYAKFTNNVDAFTGRKRYDIDKPAGKNLDLFLDDVEDVVLPPLLGFHRRRIIDDLKNEDYTAFRNDMLGTVGLRPRYIRPGEQAMRAEIQLNESMRNAKNDLRRSLRRSKSAKRNQELVEEYKQYMDRAIQQYKKRVGIPENADELDLDNIDQGKDAQR